MGSSVFHGGFSTFLAISALGPSKSYIFVVFFKMWCGIIVFGMCNGFFLLPVVLSLIGPIEDDESTPQATTETQALETEPSQKILSD